MDQRIVEFITALRAAGVRVSLAESQDAFEATEVVGVMERELFKSSLAATLIKEGPDREVFEKLFPYYFGSGGPPLLNPQEGMGEQSRPAVEVAVADGIQAQRLDPVERRFAQRELVKMRRRRTAHALADVAGIVQLGAEARMGFEPAAVGEIDGAGGDVVNGCISIVTEPAEIRRRGEEEAEKSPAASSLLGCRRRFRRRWRRGCDDAGRRSRG